MHGLGNDGQKPENRPQQGIDQRNPPHPLGDEFEEAGHNADGGKQGKEKRGIEINARKGRDHAKEQAQQSKPAHDENGIMAIHANEDRLRAVIKINCRHVPQPLPLQNIPLRRGARFIPLAALRSAYFFVPDPFVGHGLGQVGQ